MQKKTSARTGSHTGKVTKGRAFYGLVLHFQVWYHHPPYMLRRDITNPSPHPAYTKNDGAVEIFKRHIRLRFLESLKFQPGKCSGTFVASARRAISHFQEAGAGEQRKPTGLS